MSKSKRNNKGQFVRSHSMGFVIGAWALAVASLVLVWLACRAVMADIGSFRSCTTGTGILSVSSCGKRSIDLGDLLLLGLLVLAIGLSISLITAAWRATTKGTVVT